MESGVPSSNFIACRSLFLTLPSFLLLALFLFYLAFFPPLFTSFSASPAMKIRTLVLGEYGTPPVVFGLHLFPAPLTPPLTSPPSQGTAQENYFLCLEDLEALFFSKSGNNAKDLLNRSNFYKDQKTGRSYVMTRAVAEAATKLGLDDLADLCRLTEYDVFHGTTDDLLSRIENLNSCRKSVIEQELTIVRKDTVSPIIRLSPPEDGVARRDQVRFDPCRDSEDKR